MIYKESRVTIKRIAMECVQTVNGGRSVFKGDFRRCKPYERKEGGMVKRSIIVMGLIFAMMGMFMNDASATLILGRSSFFVSSYFSKASIKGGLKPTIIGESFLLSAIEPIDAFIACKNGGKTDVRNQGGGGTTIFQITDLATGSEGGLGDREQGRFYVSTHPICWTVDEHLEKDCDNIIFDGPNAVGPEDCRNLQWDPYQYLMQTLKLSGALQICEDGFCTTGDEKIYFCETKTPTNIVWLADPDICDPSTDPYCVCESIDGTNFCTNVTYLCWDFGSPVAFDDPDIDSYSTRRTLNVKAPGVLNNDHDTCDITTDACTQLTAIPVADAPNGEVHLNSDGSFTYTPDTGFTGVDFFTYKAVDEDGSESNVATVTITVK
jgi:hypothetical protein